MVYDLCLSPNCLLETYLSVNVNPRSCFAFGKSWRKKMLETKVRNKIRKMAKWTISRLPGLKKKE